MSLEDKVDIIVDILQDLLHQRRHLQEVGGDQDRHGGLGFCEVQDKGESCSFVFR